MQGQVHLSSLRVGGNNISITICSRHLLLLTSICFYSKKMGTWGWGMLGIKSKMKKQELLKLMLKHVSYCSSFFQGSPGQPGLPGKDGMKGEKVCKSIVYLEAHCDWGCMFLM